MRRVYCLICCLAFSFSLYATHQRTAEITYRHISGYTYEFTIHTFYSTGINVADRDVLVISWGNNNYDTVGRSGQYPYPDYNVKENWYVIQHTFPGPNQYIISMEDVNRNAGVINIPNSVDVAMYISTTLTISSFLTSGDNSPILLNKPMEQACLNTPYIYNPEAYDPDGDSLSFRLVNCKGLGGTEIPGYTLPASSTEFSINELSGEITWDSPILSGVYNIAFVIEEYRKGVKIGSVTRDMQLEAQVCKNKPPSLNFTTDTCITAGDTLRMPIYASDPDTNDIITLSVNGEVFQNPTADIHFSAVKSKSPATGTLTWIPKCSDVRAQNYQFFFKATDNGSPNLFSSKTMHIRVLPPPVKLLSVTSGRSLFSLTWERSQCEEAVGYQIYRKEGHGPSAHNSCDNFADSSYVLVTTIPNIDSLNFTDYLIDEDDLIAGTTYCYVVLVLCKDNYTSVPSNEECAILNSDNPTVLNVDVRATNAANGAIYLRWQRPASILDSNPDNYFYYIWGNPPGSMHLDFIDSISSSIDTTYMVTGLNTVSNRYEFKIELYEKNQLTRIGSSRKAQSLYLNAVGKNKRCELRWHSAQAWINHYFVIERENGSQFDSIGITSSLSYTDSNVVNGEKYSYRLRAYGSYEPNVSKETLINYSQITSAIPELDTPCPPKMFPVQTNCDPASNLVSWEIDEDCAEMITSYEVYYQPYQNAELILLTTTSEEYYLHQNLSSIAGCYSIRAINSQRMKSDFSDSACVDYDRCMDYSLPNFFSPNDDGYNDYFEAFSHEFAGGFNIQIFNSWGRLVFESTDPDFKWDGKDIHSKQNCPDGAYYYIANIEVNGWIGKYEKKLTGSVTILR